MSNVFVLEHPLAKTFLLKLRDKDTPPDVFRANAKRLGNMLALEVTKDIKTRPEKV